MTCRVCKAACQHQGHSLVLLPTVFVTHTTPQTIIYVCNKKYTAIFFFTAHDFVLDVNKTVWIKIL